MLIAFFVTAFINSHSVQAYWNKSRSIRTLGVELDPIREWVEKWAICLKILTRCKRGSWKKLVFANEWVFQNLFELLESINHQIRRIIARCYQCLFSHSEQWKFIRSQYDLSRVLLFIWFIRYYFSLSGLKHHKFVFFYTGGNRFMVTTDRTGTVIIIVLDMGNSKRDIFHSYSISS